MLFRLLFLLFLFANVCEAQTIINQYAAIQSFSGCNSLVVDNVSGFANGDDVLIIQMKGAQIDTTNTVAFGTLINLNNCGNYEINKISSITGTTISLTNNMLRTYDVQWGKVQLVKIPHYSTYTVATQHSCMPWNGIKGGVFAIIVDNTLTLNNSINVSEKGFRKGVNQKNIYHQKFTRNQQDYCFPINDFSGAMKGEGITEVSAARMYCRGALYNGGGGGNSTNSGGGGGGNAGTGGGGGDEWQFAPFTAVGGKGGKPFAYTSAVNRIIMGGGGGAGDVNDRFISDAGSGAGIILVIAGDIKGNNNSLLANGQQGIDCSNNGCEDGFGGGGAGGTVVINTQAITQLNIDVKGGRGSNLISTMGHGPGGGGGGGAIMLDNPAHFANITFNKTGGAAGLVTFNSNTTNWGATKGTDGDTVSDVTIPIASVPSSGSSYLTAIHDSIIGCKTIQLTAIATSALSTLQWSFGDGATGSGNPVTHSYAQPGTYTINIYAVSNGCLDTFSKSITVVEGQVNVTILDTVLSCRSVKLNTTSTGTPIKTYLWNLGDGNSGLGDPYTHTYNQFGSYGVTLITTDSIGCLDTFTANVTLQKTLDYSIIDSAVDCIRLYCDTLRKSGPPATTITWLFGDLNYANTSPVIHKYRTTGNYHLQLVVADINGCTDTISKDVYMGDIPIPIELSNDTSICFKNTIALTAGGAQTYQWTPKNGLDHDNATIVNARPVESITYIVKGVDSNQCVGYDSVRVTILPLPDVTIGASRENITCDDREVTLTAFGANNFIWGPASEFEDTTAATQIIYPKLNKRYYVYGFDALGCWNIAEQYIKADLQAKIFIADAFTPNADGLNDKIRPYEICNFIFESFSVYNRWGERVYTTNDITRGWDGYYKGKLQNMNTFTYMIKGQTYAGDSEIFSGNFILVH